MKPTGVNMTNVKQINRSGVLELLLTRGAMARSDLAAELNLTTATLTSICSDFVQKGLLVESDREEVHLSGRKKCPLSICYTYRYVVAISMHYLSNVIAVTDLAGNPVAVEPFPVDQYTTPETFFKAIADACIRLLWENHIPSEQVLGAGVCIIGAVDQDRGVALNPFRIFDGSPTPIKELLEKEFPFPICVENNVCSFLIAETLFGSARGNHLMAVRWGPGVGSASCSNGSICKDHNYHSSEIGHTLFYRSSGQRCKCGRTGCLETGVGIPYLASYINDLAQTEPALTKLICQYGQPDIHNINVFLSAGIPTLNAEFERCRIDLSIGVSNAMQVFSPDQIVLYGVLFEQEDVFQRFIADLQAISPDLDDSIFIRSTLDSKREYIGPVAVAVKNLLIERGG